MTLTMVLQTCFKLRYVLLPASECSLKYHAPPTDAINNRLITRYTFAGFGSQKFTSVHETDLSCCTPLED